MASALSRKQGSKSSPGALRAGLLATLACLASAPRAVAKAPETGGSPFGTVGKGPDFAWHRFYNADWTWLGWPSDPHRLYTLGKLDRRIEPQLDWCRDAGFLCLRRDKAAQRRLYDSIFAAEREPMARILKHHNADRPAPPPLHLTLGNEPNAYPYVDPEVYAETYARYRAYLRAPAPEGLGCGHCRLFTGGILLFDILPSSFLPLRGLLDAGQGSDRVTLLPWREWTLRFLRRLGELGSEADGFDVHVYHGGFDLAPFPFLRLSLLRWQDDPGALRAFVDLVRSFPGSGGRDGAAAYPRPRVWIGEFGSIKPWHGEKPLAALMRAQVEGFRKTPEVERWFWFKDRGRDVKTSLAPLTGLYWTVGDTVERTLLGETYRSLQGEHEARRRSGMR